MHRKILSKIKKSLYAIPFEDDIQHTRHRANEKKGKKDILIHNIPFLFTCDETEKLRCFQNYSIKISKGIIQEVIPARKAKPGNFSLVYEAGMRGGIVVTPGLINAHAHPTMYLMRSAMTLDEGESIDDTIASFPRWEQSMTEEDYTYSAIGDITEQQKSGITTTLSHFSSHTPVEMAARATSQHVINAVSVASSVHPETSPEVIKKLLTQKDDFFSVLAICFHYIHKAKAKVLREVQKLSEQNNLLVTCHTAESEWVTQKCRDVHGQGEIDTLEKFGILNNRMVLSHSIYVSDADIKKMVKNNVGVVHLPTSNVIHKSGTFPLWKFVDAAGRSYISLGTDGVVSKSRLDLLSEAYQTRITHLYDRTVKFGSLFKMMTVNGARTLNMPDRGRILPGMRADLAFWKLKDRGFLPFDQKNPMTLLGNLITHGSRMVRDLMVNGEFVVKSRRHTKVNESKLLPALQKKHMAMRRRMMKK